MIDWLVNRIFAWDALRDAIFDEVHMYDQIASILKDPEAMKTGSKFWNEGDGWRGWYFNEDRNVYIFNDVPMDFCDAMEIMHV